ncbi:glycoside hydrolase family 13 protein [Candidatus Riflebacteria bacterium]
MIKQINFFLSIVLLVTFASNAGSTPLFEAKFRFQSPIKVSSVNLAGSFNSWNKTANPLQYNEDSSAWEGKLLLKKGRHLYKFVIDGTNWISDPGNPVREDDGFQGYNSVLVIGNGAAKVSLKAKRGDGKIIKSGLKFKNQFPYINKIDSETLQFRFWCLDNDLSAILLVKDGIEYPLKKVGRYDNREFYLLNVRAKKPFLFYFILTDKKPFYLGKNGLSNNRKSIIPFKARIPRKPFFPTPPWLKQRIFYQIFPDRFARKMGKGRPTKKIVPWDSKPTYNNHFGGNFEGIRSKAGYLKSLGITGVYFNPIHKAESNHKYDASDYLKVDPSFGTIKEFKDLLSELQSSGMKVILDGVFNHTGDRHWAFMDIKKNGKKSKYKDWYRVKSFPVRMKPKANYDCWWGFAHLPALNYDNDEVWQHINDVVEFWLGKIKVDGFRLDVPNEIRDEFWVEFRRWVKSYPQDPWIVGEIWENAGQWLKGDMFDSVMNYRLRTAVLDLLQAKKANKVKFLGDLARIYGDYSQQAFNNLLNLLGSHDTPRIGTLIKNRKKLFLAYVILFTQPGIPMLYYGDEIGMRGGKDPLNRKGMVWDKANWDHKLLSHIKKLIQMREENPIFSQGLPCYYQGRSSVLSYTLNTTGKKVLVLINASLKPGKFSYNLKKDLPTLARVTGVSDLYSGSDVPHFWNRLNLTIPALDFRIISFSWQ